MVAENVFRSEPHIVFYWGKAQPIQGGALTWHPLAYHSLDVAGVMAALLDEWPWALARLATLARLPEDIARRWAITAAALHDLGKYADAFQSKAEPWNGRKDWPGPIPQGRFDHGAFGGVLWDNSGLAARLGHRTTRKRFRHWLAAAWGHHGRPAIPTNDLIDTPARSISPAATTDATAFAAAMLDLFGVDDTPALAGTPPVETWLFAGLSIIADWVGSNQLWCPYRAPDMSLENYWTNVAVPGGRKAVLAAGLAAAAPAETVSLATLIGQNNTVSTPLQDWAATANLPEGPIIAVIEDLTGAGKTEAALLLAHRMIRAGKGRGLYWALPTQATATMLYARLARGYRALFAEDARPSLALAHGGVDLADDFWASVIAPADVSDAQGNETDVAELSTASAECAKWLADERRRALLAHVGVGTIDQALIGALRRKHGALRLGGLAGQILIVDEVHGYDPYVTRLLEALLTSHAALGGSAILVSATLASNAKASLIKSFGKGCGWPVSKLDEKAFPLATIAASTGVETALVAATRGTRRDLPMIRLEDDRAAVAYLVAEARAGRCAVWIRNTVADAVEGYDQLRATAPDIAAMLFHARFAGIDRLTIEAKVLGMFGKGPGDRCVDGLGRVLVATQVVEQSLDLDFDVMVCDLCPLELVIQRAGRLHRHSRGERPPPVLAILGPASVSDAGPNWYKSVFPKAAFVYGDHAALWASMRVMTERGGLPLATSNPRELIEAAAIFSETAPETLTQSAEATEAKASAAKAMAAMSCINPFVAFDSDTREWGADDAAPTRLGEATRLLRLARWDGIRLLPFGTSSGWRGWRESEMQIAARHVSEISNVKSDALAIAITAARVGWQRRLDSCLILPLSEDSKGTYHAQGVNARGSQVRFEYTSERGLGIEHR